MKIYKNLYEQIISPQNLFLSWEKFKKGKRNKLDVAKFEFDLERNIFKLHRELKNRKYKHGSYFGFYIRDPKVRHIHKATVRDRVLHHLIVRILTPVFEPTFIPNSFSCRIGKGTHKGVYALEDMVRKVSKNYTGNCFVLKCDIRKFFDSVDHTILTSFIERKVKDSDTMWLLKEVIESYTSNLGAFTRERERESKTLPLFNTPNKGIPIGNLTSQIFANIYMNEFDQFVKHDLKVKNYARYTDDFVIISSSNAYLKNLLPRLKMFLLENLKLDIHPQKVSIIKYHQGIDFLGYIILPHHLLLRTRTKRRIIKNLKDKVKLYKQGLISEKSLEQTLYSYLGVLSHADTHRLSKWLKNQYWFWLAK